MRTSDELVYADQAYDRDYASDDSSRYGAYLRSRAHLFLDDGGPLDAVSFAALAWRIACSPIMSPAYVQLRAPVFDVTCRGSEDDADLLVAELEVRLPWPSRLSLRDLDGVRDWDRATPWAEDPGPFVEPADEESALLFAARLKLPLLNGADLPAPDRACPVDVDLAKRVIDELCRQANRRAAPVVERVLARWRGVSV